MTATRRALLLLGVLWFGMAAPLAHAAEPATEQQVKAVFVFKLAHFVAWPPDAFASPTEPFVIGVLGSDVFAAQVEEAVRDEQLDTHPLQVQRLTGIGEIKDCRILYIDRSHSADLARVLAALGGRNTLTVSDLDGAAQRGVMIQLATENSRIRLVANTEAARAAGLTISSNVLRQAKVVRTGDR